MYQRFFTVSTTIIFAFIICAAHCQDNAIPYESGENACKKCNCSVKETDPTDQIFTLNCADKQLKQIFANYGDLFPANNPLGTKNKTVDITYASNNINYLKQLPPINARTHFSCRRCQLNDIQSAAFIDCPNLSTLDLSWNNLNSDAIRSDIFRGRFNEQIYEPLPLVSIDLSHNQIATLNSLVFEHLNGLKRISFAYNPLNIMNQDTCLAIASLHFIEHLDLSYTNLTDIPDHLFNGTMTHLRVLNVRGNLLESVPESLSLLGESLRYLNLGENNRIKTLGDESFFGLKRLTHLYIDDMNVLDTINVGTFSFLHSLEMLSCENNLNLTEFDLSSISTSTTLRELYLSNCSLRSLEISIPKVENGTAMVEPIILPNLRIIKLENNPWYCDCSLYKWLDIFTKSHRNVFLQNGGARCTTPYDLVSDLLVDLTADTLCRISHTLKPIRVPPSEGPPFLRPRSIMLSLLSILTVIIIGMCIGLVIVRIKKKLHDNDIGFAQPIRYTTVRNSTVSTN